MSFQRLARDHPYDQVEGQVPLLGEGEEIEGAAALGRSR